jgi:hypothetical protein
MHGTVKAAVTAQNRASAARARQKAWRACQRDGIAIYSVAAPA